MQNAGSFAYVTGGLGVVVVVPHCPADTDLVISLRSLPRTGPLPGFPFWFLWLFLLNSL